MLEEQIRIATAASKRAQLTNTRSQPFLRRRGCMQQWDGLSCSSHEAIFLASWPQIKRKRQKRLQPKNSNRRPCRKSLRIPKKLPGSSSKLRIHLVIHDFSWPHSLPIFIDSIEALVLIKVEQFFLILIKV